MIPHESDRLPQHWYTTYTTPKHGIYISHKRIRDRIDKGDRKQAGRPNPPGRTFLGGQNPISLPSRWGRGGLGKGCFFVGLTTKTSLLFASPNLRLSSADRRTTHPIRPQKLLHGADDKQEPRCFLSQNISSNHIKFVGSRHDGNHELKITDCAPYSSKPNEHYFSHSFISPTTHPTGNFLWTPHSTPSFPTPLRYLTSLSLPPPINPH